MKTSIPRLRRIRFKDGRTIEMLRLPENPGSDGMWADIRAKMESHGSEVEGYAFVVWGGDYSTVALATGPSLPLAYLPDYVRNRLLLQIFERWTIDTLEGR